MRTREVNLNSPQTEPKTRMRDPFAELGDREAPSEDEMDMPVTERQAKPSNPFSDFETPEPAPVPQDTSNGELPMARTTPNHLGKEWVRQDVLSLYVPYDFNELFVRPLTLPLLSKLSLAMRTQSVTLLADVIGQCLSEDVRDLTPSDFYFMLYWVRDNSFTRSPITIKWTSRYGNENELKFRRSDLEFQELEMTKAEYAEYQAYGLCFPTVRDMELIRNDQTAPADEWMLDYAQYVSYRPADGNYADYPAKKIAALQALVDERGLEEVILKIDEFSGKIVHGVTDSVKARDAHFDPAKAAQFFEDMGSMAMEAGKVLAAREGDNSIAALQVFRGANAYLTEAAAIRTALDEGKPVFAQEEVVAIRIEATDFFPNLR